ncbi:MAG: adenylosuccinate lyase [Chitinivibrionales bacterium]|nr:adenylosuccinate lyase [Chitinivibrionales bacterium]MBD3394543.1 adenylosuccinate lyase [Chitinivibrionales bacterium]
MSTHADEKSEYTNPLIERYASRDMAFVFSPRLKFSTWRKLWVALAEAQKELGLAIDQGQIDEMKAHINDIDYRRAAELEKQMRHDVMAHVHTFAEACPSAKPVIHLGATSAFVGDNTDLVVMREACLVLLRRFAPLIAALKDFALRYKDLATLGFTHFQPAQLTTVGKRACLWLQDLAMDFEALARFTDNLPFRGAKGTTGTQASYLSLFDGDHEKVKKLDRLVADKMGFDSVLPVTGQTYTRKIDADAAAILCGTAQSLHKIANDIRLLQNLKEIEEPFGKNQVGSSAMAYKRNPMRSERLTSLSRFVLSLATSPPMTAAGQWFERTLDDSANKRLSIPQAFLAADAGLIIAHDILSGLVVYPKVIRRHIDEELPFMATETIIMAAVKKGGDRQTVHERIRVHSMEAGRAVKTEGKRNDLLDRIAGDPVFGMSAGELEGLLNVDSFVGRAPQQTVEFISDHIDPLLQRAAAYGDAAPAELTV